MVHIKRCGIYAIEHTETGRVQIGQSVDIDRRLANHRYNLRRGTHHNSHLQNAWRKYGEQAFTFWTITECAPDKLTELETFYVDWAKTHYQVYNIGIPGPASRTGIGWTDAMRNKYCATRRGMPLQITPQGLEAKRASAQKHLLVPRKPLSDDTKRKIGNANRGKSRTPEEKARIREARWGSAC